MKKEELLNELKSIFQITKIDETMSLEKLNFDSLNILDLIALKETKFKNLKIKPTEFHNCKKVIDIVKLFKVKL